MCISIRLDFVAPNRSTILVSGLDITAGSENLAPKAKQNCLSVCVVYLDVIMQYMT